MPAPKKADSDKIKQVKVHVKVSDLEKYDRHKIEQLIEDDKIGSSITLPETQFKVETSITKLPIEKPTGYSPDEQALIDRLIPNYRKSNNKLYFINRAVQLR